MKRSMIIVVGVVLVMLVGALPAVPAAAATITLNAPSITDLLGASYQTAGSQLITVVDEGNLRATIYSQAFTGDAGTYAYLWQVRNTGVSGNSSVEMYTVWPFADATSESNVGYLTGTVPVGFLAGGYIPEPDGYIESVGSGAEVSFYYTKREGRQIPTGGHSYVMYVVSDLPPSTISGNVIDGSVGSGDVVGPVPEPATLALLALGGGVMAIRRRRR